MNNARSWLTTYVKTNRTTMTAAQIKAVSTCARQIDAAWTLDDLAATLRRTLHTPTQADKPIYMIGAKTAEYILGILPK